jgi:hypothetical protein
VFGKAARLEEYGQRRELDARVPRTALRAARRGRTGREPRITAFPWWLVVLASPFVAALREMLEMRYLWREAVRMDNAAWHELQF